MLRELLKPEKLTENEFEAVREWFSDHKDELSKEFKQGIRKLISNEEKQLFCKSSC